MKEIIIPSEVIEAECPRCDGFVPATYNDGDLELSSGLRVSKVMRATCDQCGEVLEVAQQSAQRIVEAKQKSTLQLNSRKPQPTSERLTFAEGLKKGMREAIAYDKGELELRTRILEVPDPLSIEVMPQVHSSLEGPVQK